MVRDGTFSRFAHTWDFYVAIRRQITADGMQGSHPGGWKIRDSGLGSLPCYRPAVLPAR
jgi:hypothetical protein